MTSKAVCKPSRHESINAAAQQEKRSYTLRPVRNIPKKYKNTPSSAFRKNEKRLTMKSVNIKRLSTPVSNSSWKKKVTKKAAIKNVAMSDFIDDAELTNVLDMEANAFQLATYVESNDALEQIINDLENDLSANLTPSNNNAADPLNESTPLREMRLVELLDLSIRELEKSTNTNTCDNAIQSNLTPNLMNTNRIIAVDKFSSKRNNDQAETNKRANCHYVNGQLNKTDRFDRSHTSTGNFLKRRQNAVSEGPSAHSDPTELRTKLAAHNNNPNGPQFSTSSGRGDMRPTLATYKSNKVFHQAPFAQTSFVETPYVTISKNGALKHQMVRLFDRACYRYLNGRSCRGLCKWNHNLPSAHQIHYKLMRLSDDTVTYTYFNYVVKSSMTFNAYFPTMCDIFGRRKMKSILVDSIGDCEKRENIPFFKHVFNGFVMAGFSKRDSLTAIINNCCGNKDCYDVFLEIIIETDALYFIDLLTEYYLHGTVSKQCMYKLLHQVVDEPGTPLLPLFIEILDKYSMYGGFDVDTFSAILPSVKNIVAGNLSLSEQVNHIAKRMQS